MNSDRDLEFMKAVRRGDVKDAGELLLEEANIHADNDYALRHACRLGNYKMVELLLTSGANVHAYNDWAIINASIHNHIDIVRLLLENGASQEVLEKVSRQPPKPNSNLDLELMKSSKNGELKKVKLLLSQGVNIHADRDYSVRSASTAAEKR